MSFAAFANRRALFIVVTEPTSLVLNAWWIYNWVVGCSGLLMSYYYVQTWLNYHLLEWCSRPDAMCQWIISPTKSSSSNKSNKVAKQTSRFNDFSLDCSLYEWDSHSLRLSRFCLVHPTTLKCPTIVESEQMMTIQKKQIQKIITGTSALWAPNCFPFRTRCQVGSITASGVLPAKPGQRRQHPSDINGSLK